MLDKLFFISLVLSVTGLFRFVAPQLGTSIGQVSMALLAFNLLYLANRLSYLEKIFRKLLPWLILLLAWPMMAMTYAPAIEVRQLGILLNGFVLFAGTAVYTMSKGTSAIYRVFRVALVATFFGIILNLAMPDYFENVALLADARVTYLNRPGGFFMQPNDLAIGLTLIFIGWLAYAKRNTIYFEPVAILVFLGFLLLTGSRAGMIVGVLIVALHFGFQWRSTLFRVQRVRKFSTRLAIFIVLIILGMTGMKIFIETYRDMLDVQQGGLIERISNMLEFRLGEEGVGVAEGGSVRDRFEAQWAYWEKIKERPILGHGFGSEALYLDSGELFLSAHSTIISMTMQYGVFYPMIVLLLLARLLFKPNRKNVEKVLGTNTIIQFLSVTLILLAFSGGLFDRRAFLVTLGMLFAVCNFPSYIFRKPTAKSVQRPRAHPCGHPTHYL
jgi:O-antigen ligase/polysaccharide polymerase Wzy-like membrane protein